MKTIKKVKIIYLGLAATGILSALFVLIRITILKPTKPLHNPTITLEWIDESENEEGFVVEYNTGTTTAWDTIYFSSDSSFVYDIKKEYITQPYHFIVKAYNNIMEDTLSSVVEFNITKEPYLSYMVIDGIRNNIKEIKDDIRELRRNDSDLSKELRNVASEDRYLILATILGVLSVSAALVVNFLQRSRLYSGNSIQTTTGNAQSLNHPENTRTKKRAKVSGDNKIKDPKRETDQKPDN